MKKSMKLSKGWKSGAGLGITGAVLALFLVVGINSGSMKGLDGQPLVDVANIEPEAGGDDEMDEGKKDCGLYIEWIGQQVSNSALKKTGKPFRILPPNSMMTMDHNPERINVHVDETGLIENVKCG